MSSVYFDYNATTPLCEQALLAMQSAFSKIGNASSVHQYGRALNRIVEECRKEIAGHLHCLSDEIIFTSGATESINAAIHSAVESNPNSKIIITTSIEHSAVRLPLENLAKRGYEIREVSVDSQGRTDLTTYKQWLEDKPLLTTIMLANNETGMVFPVQEMASLAKSKNILFHVDAAAALGKILIQFKEWGVDFLSASAHKCYGPVGVGILLVKKGTQFIPLLRGGTQEQGRRAGTLPAALIAGMEAGLSFSLKNLEKENDRQKKLRQKIKEGLRQVDPAIAFHESIDSHQLSGTLHVGFKGLSGQTLLANLDLEGVAASFGAACQSGSLEVSRVILAMGIEPLEAAGSLRLSFGKMTTEADVEHLLGAFERVLRRMKK